ncbi:MAG TPA: hypothetical protein VF802_01655 [Candidatus Limnocylindrales bacterium]
MQHSIAARYVARPAARFVRPSVTDRERRLGLRPAGSMQAASAHPTVLRRADLGPFVELRAAWRAFAPARPTSRPLSPLRHGARLTWAGSEAPRRSRRPGAAPAPWRG